MAVKLADTLKPMTAGFPAAEAEDLEITLSDGTKKRIQKAYEDGDFGGGAEQTYDPTSPNAQSGIAVKQAIDEAVTSVLNTGF
jgi:hypothetical protein